MKTQRSHLLNPTPKTVHWGYYKSDLKPVLEISSGDTVTIGAVTSTSPSDFEAGGIDPSLIPQAHREIWRDYDVNDKGPGAHILTGPIYIKEAEPGDTLEVHINDVRITAPFGFNRNQYGRGALPEDFPYYAIRILRLDLEKMTSEVFPGIVIPLRPFFGNLGVAPVPVQGRISSGPPGIHGGNMDHKELTAGAILYLPVHVKGALFSAGDGHAVQGDGEANLSALETFMEGTFQFFVLKNKRIRWPRAETPTHFITMGLHEDLDVAAKIAVREMIDYLQEEKGINSEYAYMITSLIVDLHVTQVVDIVKGIHAMLPKNIFGERY
jgi:acetamidase/formamidase